MEVGCSVSVCVSARNACASIFVSPKNILFPFILIIRMRTSPHYQKSINSKAIFLMNSYSDFFLEVFPWISCILNICNKLCTISNHISTESFTFPGNKIFFSVSSLFISWSCTCKCLRYFFTFEDSAYLGGMEMRRELSSPSNISLLRPVGMHLWAKRGYGLN